MKIILTVLLALTQTLAHAGRSCEPQTLSEATLAQAMQLAQRTAQALDASQAQVVVLARTGADLRKYGLQYSHLGFAYKTDGANPVWRVVHKLNHCGQSTSALYRQGLGEFYMDDLWRFEGAFMVPNAALQAKLLAFLKLDTAALALHEPRYNMVSYPWSLKYQQSNQWALEVMAVAELGNGGRAQAQDLLMNRGYQPTTLNIPPLTRLGANASRASVSFDDHPNQKRFSDRIETVTVDSVFRFMQTSGWGMGGVQALR